MNSNVTRLSEIEACPITRYRIWENSMDFIYGYSEFSDHIEWGMPKGKISLIAGCPGVGKSRLSIQIAKSFSKYNKNETVLYFQTESTLSDFASWTKDTTKYPNIYCSSENRLEEMIKIIYELKPKLVIVDSVNEMEEFENGTKKEAKRLIKGVYDKETGLMIKPGFKKATMDVGAHTILLGQINQDGKTIKGGTSLPHLVDIDLRLNPVPPEETTDIYGKSYTGIFKVFVGIKHRYGDNSNWAWYQHCVDNLLPWTFHYWYDAKWQETFPNSPKFNKTPIVKTPVVETPVVKTPVVETPASPTDLFDPKVMTPELFTPVPVVKTPEYDIYAPEYNIYEVGSAEYNAYESHSRAIQKAYEESPEGRAYMKEAEKRNRKFRKSHQPGIYDKIGEFFDSIVNKESY